MTNRDRQRTQRRRRRWNRWCVVSPSRASDGGDSIFSCVDSSDDDLLSRKWLRRCSSPATASSLGQMAATMIFSRTDGCGGVHLLLLLHSYITPSVGFDHRRSQLYGTEPDHHQPCEPCLCKPPIRWSAKTHPHACSGFWVVRVRVGAKFLSTPNFHYILHQIWNQRMKTKFTYQNLFISLLFHVLKRQCNLQGSNFKIYRTTSD